MTSSTAATAAGGQDADFASLFALMDTMPMAISEVEEPPRDTGPSSDEDQNKMEELEAKIVYRIFPREFKSDDEFAVYATEDNRKRAVKITYAGHYRPEKHEKVLARGKWVIYKGEPSFKASIMVPEIPKGAEGAATWLKIAKIDGMGQATIKKLVVFHGDNLPKALESVEAIIEALGEKKRKLAERTVEAYTSLIGQPKLVTFLGSFGLRESLIQKVIKRFGAASMRIVEENPWKLAETVDGIGFEKSDKIARKAGLDMRSPERMKAGLRYVLNQKTNQQGHCGLARDDLVSAADSLLSVGREHVEKSVDTIIEDRDAIFDEDVGLIYPVGLYKAENHLAGRIKTIMLKGDRIDEGIARAAVEKAVSDLGYQRDERQVAAAIMAVVNPISVITGGPGTGKSTTQRIIVAALSGLSRKFVLAAPTGRAAKRLAEVTGKEASTCHRLLSYSAEKGDFLFDRSNPFKEDRFIVDEFSMIDLKLASSFMDAVRDQAGVTIVGDVDQLPSVGSGQVLKDLIDSGVVPVTVLKTVHRQAGDSGIVVAAERINNCQRPVAEGEKLEGFYMKTGFTPYSGDDEIVKDVVDFMSRRLPNGGFNPVDDIQVLAPMKKGSAGIFRLNAELKAALNPGTPETTSVFGRGEAETRYSEGDRVMHTRNDYTKKVYNGEVGIVVDTGMRTGESGREEPFIKVDYSGHAAYYGPDSISDVTMAWASTVHKSQGCEFPVVIMVCPMSQRSLLNKNLFYTGVTRAKKVCIVIGNEEAVNLAVNTENTETRATGLARRLAA